MEELQIRYVPIGDIHRYANNPRDNEGAVDAVANSIREFGFNDPIVVDAAMTIVAGDTRYQAAQKLGLEEVPVVVADTLSSEQIQAFRIIDNKTHELSKWDFGKLDEELSEINNIDMRLFGFGDDALADKFAGVQNLDEGTELSLDDFEDENFECECPVCGFRFNETEG